MLAQKGGQICRDRHRRLCESSKVPSAGCSSSSSSTAPFIWCSIVGGINCYYYHHHIDIGGGYSRGKATDDEKVLRGTIEPPHGSSIGGQQE